jgi:hypothetical protein
MARAPRSEQALTVALRGMVGRGVRLFAWTALALVAAIFPAVVAGPVVGTGAFVAVLALGILHTQAYGRPRAVVGSDGVRIQVGPRPVFVAYRDLRSALVARVPEGTTEGPTMGEPDVTEAYPVIRLKHNDGKVTDLPIVAVPTPVVERVLERIRRGIRRAHRAEDELLLSPREGQSLEAWRKRLADDVGGGVAFRSRVVSPDDVEDVLANPLASAEQRIAAALALTSTGAPRGPAVRAAATTANEQLRKALLAIADGSVDDEVVEEALGRSVARERSG